jgi:CheY-like chemotaxis protein/HPt (histidine-containing phosphotransfer) domain-containing protein
VLLAEDNPVSQTVTGTILLNLGFDVDVVADGATAVDAATRNRYDAILMDCQMPLVDGYRAATEIRRLPAGSRYLPIIAITATPEEVGQERALAAGMDDYLTKPFSMSTLGSVLDRWIDRSPETATIDHARPLADTEASCVDAVANGGPVLDPDIIDRLERLGRAAGQDLLGWLATLFLADAGRRTTAMLEALVEDNAAVVAASAHTLAGASANLGAARLARLCDSLATAAAAGDLTTGLAGLAAIEAELGRVRVGLSAQTRSP